MRRHIHPGPRSRNQSGSIIVPAALSLAVAVAMLWGVQIGYVIYAKRDLQKAADLAALTGAQVLLNGRFDCGAATTAATQAATANVMSDPPVVNCKRWNPNTNKNAPYTSDPDSADPANAVAVTLTRTVEPLIPFTSSSRLTVSAIGARSGAPQAVFSVGTSLVKTAPGLLTDLLSSQGLDLGNIDGYDGLAGVTITPAGLLQALGIDVPADISVADFNALLAANTEPLDGLLDAAITAAGRAPSDFASAKAALLGALKTQLKIDPTDIQLGTKDEASGRTSSLFALVNSGDAQAALNARINVLDLISSATSVASAQHAVFQESNITFHTTDLGLPSSVLNGAVSATAAVGVIQPAQIGIGGVGATAYDAQQRIFVQAIVHLSLLGLYLDVNLPIALDAVQATATVTDLCTTQDGEGHDLATIQVDAPLATICLGGFDQNTVFGGSAACSSGSVPPLKQPLVSLAIGDPSKVSSPTYLIKLNNPIAIEGSDFKQDLTLYQGQVSTTKSNSLAIGSTISDVLTQAVNLTQGAFDGKSSSVKAMASTLWNNTPNQCNPSQPGQAGYACRSARWQQALNGVSSTASGLAGAIGTLGSNSPLAPIGTLASNVLGSVTGLLNGILGVVGVSLPTNMCAATTTLPVIGTSYSGSSDGCITEINNTLAQNNATPSGTTKMSSALLSLIGFVATPVRYLLDDAGTHLSDFFEKLGIYIDQTDVRLMSLQCNGPGVQLVY